jgi:signal transduction histidine kinase
MVKSSQRTFLVLLSVVLVALFFGLFLREMIVKDFQDYVEGERSALVRPVSSDLEASYEKNRKWDRESVAGIVARALQLGLQVKLVDTRGDVVMDTELALAFLPSDRTSRIRETAGFVVDDTVTDYRSYPLVIGKENAGRLDVKFLGKGRSDAFTSRAGAIVMTGVFLLAVLALGLVTLISRKQARPVRKSVSATSDAADLHAGMPVSVKSETTTVPVPEKEKASEVEPALRMVVATEDEPESIPDDPLDVDDEDMQPLAGDPDRISKIVKGLDGLAKAQALRSALQKQPLELSPYLSNIVEKARQSFPGTEVTFNVECRNDLSMSADPECLMGIMTNLLDNAAKAVKHDGMVTVSASERGDQIEFAIRDTGCGIRRKALPHIFERFYRGSGDGIGLGLTIVKELVDACAGTIAVQSTRGKGSVFIVCIPRS